MVEVTGLEPVTPCLQSSTLEFHNFLKFNKLLRQRDFRLANFSQFWQILERFSHTNSHTEISAV